MEEDSLRQDAPNSAAFFFHDRPDATILESPSSELYAAYCVGESISAITNYYMKACDELFDDSGHVNNPAPNAIEGCILLNTIRRIVLKRLTHGQQAVLSLVWGLVESKLVLFHETTNQFEAKIKEVMALDARWNYTMDQTEILGRIVNGDLYKIISKFLEAMSWIPVMTSIQHVKPPTRSSLDLNLETFNYTKMESPKDTIRVVRMELKPLSPESPIFLTTRTIRLQDNIPYATLSYTWGNPFGVFCSQDDRDAIPRTDIPIVCDGKVLEVGENLYRFLWRWRQSLDNFGEMLQKSTTPDDVEHARPPLEFWIDAICINQEDIEEKNQQVSMMGDIYSRSVKTWVWLGDEDEFSRAAFKLLFQVAHTRQENDGARFQNLTQMEKDTMLVERDLPNTKSWKWFALFTLFQRQWFRRSWVVQEAALSRDIEVLCGTLCMPWTSLVIAYVQLVHLDLLNPINLAGAQELSPERQEFVFLDYRSGSRAAVKRSAKEASELRFHSCKEGTAPDIATVLSKITRFKLLDPEYMSNNGVYMIDNERDALDFLDLWDLSRTTLCGDPRDKVYAMTSLANRDVYIIPGTIQDRKLLVPDYNKSVREVYCEAAWFILLTHGSLEILSMVGHVSRENEHDLPSWVPDLSRCPKYRPLLITQKSEKGLEWCTDGGMSWKVPDPSLRYQKYLGVQISFVGKIRDAMREEHAPKHDEGFSIDYPRILEFYKLLSPTYLDDPNGQSAFEVLWRTMMADFADGASPAAEKYGEEFRKSCTVALQEASDDFRLDNPGGNHYVLFYALLESLGIDLLVPGDREIVFTKDNEEFHMRTFETMGKRRLFIVDTGYVGCGEENLRAGDIVAIVAGYPIPFILRQGSGGTYEAIGEAYVHGIMFGEHAMKPDVKWESIILE